MLASLFLLLLIAGTSAIVVLWVLAMRTAWNILAGVRAGGGSLAVADWIKLVVWPFAMRNLAGAPAEPAANLSRMLVALFAAFLVATASMAVYSNLTFVPPARTQ